MVIKGLEKSAPMSDSESWANDALHRYAKYGYIDADQMDKYRKYFASIYDKYHDSDRWSEIESIINSYSFGEPGLFDRLGYGLGLGSKHQSAVIDSLNQVLAGLGQINSTNREEQYNSASSAVARQTAAGINADLAGVEGAGQASEFTEPEPLPYPQPSMDFPSFASDLIGMASTAVGMASSLQGLTGMKIDQDAKLHQLATDFIQSYNFGYGSSGSTLSGGKYVPGAGDPESIRRYLSERADSMRLSHSEKKRFVESGVNGFYNLQGQKRRYQDYAEREQSRLNAGKVTGEILGYGEKSSDGFDTLAATASYSYEIARLNLDSRSKSEKAQNDYSREYYSNLDGEQAAITANNVNAAHSVQAQSYGLTEPEERGARRSGYKLKKKANDITIKYLETLHRNAQNGDPIAQFMLLQIASSSLGTNPVGDAMGTIMDIAGIIK